MIWMHLKNVKYFCICTNERISSISSRHYFRQKYNYHAKGFVSMAYLHIFLSNEAHFYDYGSRILTHYVVPSIPVPRQSFPKYIENFWFCQKLPPHPQNQCWKSILPITLRLDIIKSFIQQPQLKFDAESALILGTRGE